MAPRLYIATNGMSVWYSDNLGDELQRTQTARGACIREHRCGG